MAKMVPNWSKDDLVLAIPETKHGWQGERALFEFMMEELPDDWTVVYNTYIEVITTPGGRMDYMNVRRNKGEEYRQNQLDFLVFVPGKGVVNVDAKGWGYQRCGANEVRLGGDPANHNVFDQANEAIHTFDAYVRKYYTQHPAHRWGAFGHLVTFVFDDPGVVGVEYACKKDLIPGGGQFRKKIEKVLEKHNINSDVFRYFNDYEALLLRDFAAVARSGVSFPSDYDKLEQYSMIHLGGEQADVKDLIRDNQYVWVRGGAGTGKTILATQCATEFANAGKRVLYVCFNKMLATRLCLRTDLKHDRIKIAHFNGLPQKLVNQDMTVMGANGPDWEQTIKKIGRELSIIMRQKRIANFDVLLVDEAQDFRDEQIAILLRVMKPERKVVLFSDPEQTIYQSNETAWDEKNIKDRFPNVVIPQALDKDYRNTDKIYDHFKELIASEMKPQLKSNRVCVNGRPYRVEPVDETHVDVVKSLRAYFDDGMRKRSDVAVLAYTTNTLEMLPRQIKLNSGENVRISENLADWIGDKCVYKSTVQSFKGLEANCLIIIDDSEKIEDEDQRNLLRYVGESRAKFKLIIAKPT